MTLLRVYSYKPINLAIFIGKHTKRSLHITETKDFLSFLLEYILCLNLLRSFAPQIIHRGPFVYKNKMFHSAALTKLRRYEGN